MYPYWTGPENGFPILKIELFGLLSKETGFTL